ncbi:unnamed protein product [Allacma fusca]|uniref:Uncharacterized protein n=1 Tax=Allacma fusca TaxID=39272 RepID=A0A8J2PB58_9HEXA|nr:unnamed protein product [Allacma fusca]
MSHRSIGTSNTTRSIISKGEASLNTELTDDGSNPPQPVRDNKPKKKESRDEAPKNSDEEKSERKRILDILANLQKNSNTLLGDTAELKSNMASLQTSVLTQTAKLEELEGRVDSLQTKLEADLVHTKNDLLAMKNSQSYRTRNVIITSNSFAKTPSKAEMDAVINEVLDLIGNKIVRSQTGFVTRTEKS